MSNFISFKILALEVDNTTTIKDSKICIENEKIGQCSTTSKDGIAEFIVKESEKLNPFKVKIVDKEYKEFPVHSRELIANSLRDHTQELRFERKIPILRLNNQRKRSIIDDTPAIFPIDGYEEASKDIPWYQFDFMEEVTENIEIIDSLIDKSIETNSINHNRLIKAIIYLESTHGYYDRVLLGFNKSFRPMNIYYDYWKEFIDRFGYLEYHIKSDKKANIKIGYELIKAIMGRIENPTVEKVGSIFNFIGKEQISTYGVILKHYYDEQPWLIKKDNKIESLIKYLEENPPSTKNF